jgi:hypothetical protein
MSKKIIRLGRSKNTLRSTLKNVPEKPFYVGAGKVNLTAQETDRIYSDLKRIHNQGVEKVNEYLDDLTDDDSIPDKFRDKRRNEIIQFVMKKKDNFFRTEYGDRNEMYEYIRIVYHESLLEIRKYLLERNQTLAFVMDGKIDFFKEYLQKTEHVLETEKLRKNEESSKRSLEKEKSPDKENKSRKTKKKLSSEEDSLSFALLRKTRKTPPAIASSFFSRSRKESRKEDKSPYRRNTQLRSNLEMNDSSQVKLRSNLEMNDSSQVKLRSNLETNDSEAQDCNSFAKRSEVKLTFGNNINYLSEKNPHERDSNITNYMTDVRSSVTTLTGYEYPYPNKDLSINMILGTKLHKDIEIYYNTGVLNRNAGNIQEMKFFENFVDQCYKIPYRTEWSIYSDEMQLSGTVDMVFDNKDGTYTIYDWKRTFKLSVNDKKRYTLQLNLYKKILEKSYGLKIKDMYLLCLHNKSINFLEIKIDAIEISIPHILATISSSKFIRYLSDNEDIQKEKNRKKRDGVSDDESNNDDSPKWKLQKKTEKIEKKREEEENKRKKEEKKREDNDEKNNNNTFFGFANHDDFVDEKFVL